MNTCCMQECPRNSRASLQRLPVLVKISDDEVNELLWWRILCTLMAAFGSLGVETRG